MKQVVIYVESARLLREIKPCIQSFAQSFKAIELSVVNISQLQDNSGLKDSELIINLSAKPMEPQRLSYGVLEIIDQAGEPFGSPRFGLAASAEQAPVSDFSFRFSQPAQAQIQILEIGSATTALFFHQNRRRLRIKSLNLLLARISQWITNDQLISSLQTDHDVIPTQATTPVKRSSYLRYWLRTMRFADTLFVRHIVQQQRYRWEIAITTHDYLSADLSQGHRVQNEPFCFLADPFCVTEQGRTVIFAEEFDYRTKRGQIACYEVLSDTSGKIWTTRLGIALAEPFHLSFPFVFRDQGKLWMVPESSANRDIRIYECLEFPLHWQLHHIAMRDVSAVDSLIFEKDEKWWLLTNLDSSVTGDHASELHAFSADSPMTDHWTPHPTNPVCHDARKARNGGLIQLPGLLLRVSQMGGFFRYGVGTQVHQIEQITANTYNETQLKTQWPDYFEHLEGHHHLSGNSSWTVYDSCLLDQIAKVSDKR